MTQSKLSLGLILTLAALGLSTPAHADFVTFGAGDWNVFRDHDHSMWYGVQYRGNYIWDKFLPDIGVGGNNDGAVYGYAGLQYDWNIAGNFYMLPGFGVGAYRQGGSKDLGGAVEFKSSIELDYQFDCGWRAGVALWHLSNASIYDHNPGTETVEFNVAIPFSTIMNAR